MAFGTEYELGAIVRPEKACAYGATSRNEYLIWFRGTSRDDENVIYFASSARSFRAQAAGNCASVAAASASAVWVAVWMQDRVREPIARDRLRLQPSRPRTAVVALAFGITGQAPHAGCGSSSRITPALILASQPRSPLASRHSAILDRGIDEYPLHGRLHRGVAGRRT